MELERTIDVLWLVRWVGSLDGLGALIWEYG